MAADAPGHARPSGERDGYALQRIVLAQDTDETYQRAIAELRAGRKTSHWMWFVFPQIAGLGRSPMARHYAIAGLEEARAYLAHPVLGGRLVECVRILSELSRSDATAILGSTDAQKLQSSMTLFARAAPGQPLFQSVLDTYFAGQQDRGTTARLSRSSWNLRWRSPA